MNKRVYDVAFKKMAVELSDTKGSVKFAVEELGIGPGRISIGRTSIKVSVRVLFQLQAWAMSRKKSEGYRKNSGRHSKSVTS